MKYNNWIRTGLFVAAGAAAGLVYYRLYGCTTGCPITSNPWMTMAYLGVVGGLLSGIFAPKKKED